MSNLAGGSAYLISKNTILAGVVSGVASSVGGGVWSGTTPSASKLARSGAWGAVMGNAAGLLANIFKVPGASPFFSSLAANLFSEYLTNFSTFQQAIGAEQNGSVPVDMTEEQFRQLQAIEAMSR